MNTSATVFDGYLVLHHAATRPPQLLNPRWRLIPVNSGLRDRGPRIWLAFDARRHRVVVVLGELNPILTSALEGVGARLILRWPGHSTYLVSRRNSLRRDGDDAFGVRTSRVGLVEQQPAN